MNGQNGWRATRTVRFRPFHLPQIAHQPVENLAVDLEVSQAIPRNSKWKLIIGIDGLGKFLDVGLVLRVLGVQIHLYDLCNCTMIILIEVVN